MIVSGERQKEKKFCRKIFIVRSESIVNFTFLLLLETRDLAVDRAATLRLDSEPCENADGPIRRYPRTLPRDFLSLFFLRRDRKGPDRSALSFSFPQLLSLSSSLSFARLLLVFSAWPTERERKIERSRARGGGWKTLTRISLQAREESTGEESEGQDQENERRRYKKSARKRERERGKEAGDGEGNADAPRKELSLSLPHAVGVANPSLSTIYQ